MYVKAPIPSEVYHLTKKANLESILDDGAIRRFDDTECWFCESLAKMKAYMELINQHLLNIRKIPDGKQNVLHRHVRSQQEGRARAGKQKNGFPLLPQGGCWWSGLHDLFKQCFSIEFLHEFHVRYLFS